MNEQERAEMLADIKALRRCASMCRAQLEILVSKRRMVHDEWRAMAETDEAIQRTAHWEEA